LLDGVAGFVPDAEHASGLVVSAIVDGVPEVYLLPCEGLARATTPAFDRTRRLGTVRLDAAVADDADRIASGADATTLVAALHDRAAVALAADAVGGAERVLELTVEHLEDRRQFGRPLGLFQALKHRAADMLFLVEGSRSAVDHAADRLGTPDAPVVASIAKSYAGDAYVRVAQEGVQLHGGIGYTWEHDLHRYLKRARLGQVLHGDSAWHRERLADAALAGR
jgi:alkylation response protein AidB-like acyl-CoA dehydrogenase